MKYLDHHSRPFLSGILWLLLFAAVGCTQKNCSGTRPEACRSDNQVPSQSPEKPTDRSGHVVQPAGPGVAISRPGTDRPFPNKAVVADPHPARAKNDTVAVNRQRRQVITDFRDLLFMYAKTQSPREKEFFKTSAIRKIHEIPSVKLVIIPQADIYALFRETTPVESGWIFTPILDLKKSIIIGVAVQEKKAVL